MLELRGDVMRAKRLFLPALAIAAAVIASIQPALWEDTRAITRVPTTVKAIALTLDDGPHSKMTPEILAVLKEKGCG
jgi:peptidoglycan/xylan/chitin deacetylase (PgdA/CDA1 family)